MALPRMLTTCIQPSSKTIAVTHHNARKGLLLLIEFYSHKNIYTFLDPLKFKVYILDMLNISNHLLIYVNPVILTITSSFYSSNNE